MIDGVKGEEGGPATSAASAEAVTQVHGQARGGRGGREGEGEARTTRWLEGGEEVHSLSFGTMLRGSTEGGNKQKNYIHR